VRKRRSSYTIGNRCWLPRHSNSAFRNDAAANTQAYMRFMGSLAFVPSPRSAYSVVEEKTDDGHNAGQQLFLEAKTNIGPKQRYRGLAYRLLPTEHLRPGITAVTIHFN
jgi:hypothetical protein